MDVIAQECEFVTGGSTDRGGAGDSSILTAVGVFEAMRAAAEHVWGAPTLAGKRVGIEGAGKVGSRLAAHLLDDGAKVLITDVSPAALDALPGEVEVVAPGALASESLDVFSPCALGGSLSRDVVAGLRAEIVCGGANNQLAEPSVSELLAARGITYVPDFVANAGGIIQVGAEVRGYTEAEARAKTMAIFDTTKAVLDQAHTEGRLPEDVAERRAEARMGR
jgi:valine dehydrogenase (NAD+)